eukprot:403360162
MQISYKTKPTRINIGGIRIFKSPKNQSKLWRTADNEALVQIDCLSYMYIIKTDQIKLLTMKTKSTIILLALVAGTFAAGNMKNKLAQMNSKTLAQNSNGGDLQLNEDICNLSFGDLPSVELPECPCQFSELPGLGAGLNTGYSQEALVLQQNLLSTVPDTQYSQICQSNCCACEEEAHASYANEAKNRTFVIQGSISVLETLRKIEAGQARENSQGVSEKQTICQTNNAQGGLGSSQDCLTASVCPPELGSHNGGSTNGGVGTSLKQ